MIELLALLAAGLVALCTVLSIRRDPRWLGNAYLLGLSVLLVAPVFGLLFPLGGLLIGGTALVLLALAPLAVLVLVGFLFSNGVTMLRRHGRSLSNLLALLAGIAILAVMLVSLGALLHRERITAALAAFAVFSLGYIAGEFVLYVLYSWWYARLARRVPAEYVIVLGAGLRNGRTVGKILAGRVDAGIENYRRQRAAGRDTKLVMSGGQGSDEQVTEARAMTEYAIEQGVPAEHILQEGRSTNTLENLAYTRELLVERSREHPTGALPTPLDRPRTGTLTPLQTPRLRPTMLIVTSDFHTLRAALYARRTGLPAHSVGARTARYYWPSAMLREFVAVVNERRAKHLILWALVALPVPLLLVR